MLICEGQRVCEATIHNLDWAFIITVACVIALGYTVIVTAWNFISTIFYEKWMNYKCICGATTRKNLPCYMCRKPSPKNEEQKGR